MTDFVANSDGSFTAPPNSELILTYDTTSLVFSLTETGGFQTDTFTLNPLEANTYDPTSVQEGSGAGTAISHLAIPSGSSTEVLEWITARFPA